VDIQNNTKKGISRWPEPDLNKLNCITISKTSRGIPESPVSVARTRWVTPARRMGVRFAALFAIGIGGASASGGGSCGSGCGGS
jgi:hypothetical protein